MSKGKVIDAFELFRENLQDPKYIAEYLKQALESVDPVTRSRRLRSAVLNIIRANPPQAQDD